MTDDKIIDAIDEAETVDPARVALREAIERLADLDGLEYDQRRKLEAKRLDVRVTVLDEAVRQERKARRNGAGPPDQEDPRPPAFTDEALALQFAEKHKDELRYVAVWGRWFIWDGARWATDDTLRAFDLSRAVCRAAAALCDNGKIGAAVASAKTVAAVERLAKADRRLAATLGQWDQDIWKANTPQGVIDLKTGNLRPHRREDYMTKVTAVAPGGDCPLWRKFLARITDGDTALEAFLQRMAGYALTGSTQDHAMFFGHGGGGNGKGVMVSTLAGVMGDYHTTAPMEAFVSSSFDRHPTELAGLRGARLVTATETEEGRHWAESKIKALTGGDKIAARFMRQDFFEFVPQFKLLITGNHKPALRNIDEAIRRRMYLVPFAVTIPEDERDETLTEKLKAEWPGILQWMIDGCLEWQEHALRPPDAVRQATEEYLEEEDAFALWFDECCERSSMAHETNADLFASWKRWAEGTGETVGNRKRFGQTMRMRGFKPSRKGKAGGRGFDGIRLIRADYSNDPRHP